MQSKIIRFYQAMISVLYYLFPRGNGTGRSSRAKLLSFFTSPPELPIYTVPFHCGLFSTLLLLELGDDIDRAVDLLGSVVEVRAEAEPEAVIAGFAQGCGNTRLLQSREK